MLLITLALSACGSPSEGDDFGAAPPDAHAPADLAQAEDLAQDVDGGSGPSVTPGAINRILLDGTIVLPDQVIEGQVLVEDAVITCVEPGTACAQMTAAMGATLIQTEGIIAPGLIDTHNHILFDVFNEDDWSPTQLYQNHNAWTTDPRYQAMLDVKQCLSNDAQGKPTWCANTPYGNATGSLRCEMDKFGELKGLIAGTTSIVGLPGTSSGCFSSLVRSIDVPQNELDTDTVQTSAIFPPSKASGDGVCANFASGKTTAYLVHCGEGVDAASLAEFQKLGSLTTTPGCLLAPQTTITHGTAFGAAEFATMAQHQMKLTWSPASNVFLYGSTANIPAALDAGVTIALAPDWSMGGSQNLLDELRFAQGWDHTHFGDRLAPKDLVRMTTENAAQALALADRIGRIQVGYFADLAVFAGDRSHAYDAIIAASPKDVLLTMVGGQALYGAAVLKDAGPAFPACEMLDVCGTPKFLCAATLETTMKLNQTSADIEGALQQAMLDADAQTPTDGWNFAPLPPLVKCP
ncbi:MAG: amidohydrolase family protein [Polyangia bacterium]